PPGGGPRGTAPRWPAAGLAGQPPGRRQWSPAPGGLGTRGDGDGRGGAGNGLAARTARSGRRWWARCYGGSTGCSDGTEAGCEIYNPRARDGVAGALGGGRPAAP